MEDELVPDRTAEPVALPEPPVMLFLNHPHTRFDMSGVGLEDLVPEGTAYSKEDADRVRMMCRKYGIGYSDGQ